MYEIITAIKNGVRIALIKVKTLNMIGLICSSIYKLARIRRR
jgi:hypothetical protein